MEGEGCLWSFFEQYASLKKREQSSGVVVRVLLKCRSKQIWRSMRWCALNGQEKKKMRQVL